MNLHSLTVIDRRDETRRGSILWAHTGGTMVRVAWVVHGRVEPEERRRQRPPLRRRHGAQRRRQDRRGLTSHPHDQWCVNAAVVNAPPITPIAAARAVVRRADRTATTRAARLMFSMTFIAWPGSSLRSSGCG